jgi:site-specific recombinase XerD
MTPPAVGFPALVQEFFHRRLLAERGVSAHTIASYRDTFELLLRYAERCTGRTPSALTLDDLDAPLVLDFLDHLEHERGNSPRTRNLRLTAIRSFMRYASLRDPAALPVAERVLALSPKRFDRPALEFLTRDEIDALLAAPDRESWSGHRDAVLLAVLYNSGARVSELANLPIADLRLTAIRSFTCTAKDANSASSRSGNTPPNSSAPGSHTSTGAPTRRSSPTAPANR